MFLLNIDTATEHASVCITKDAAVIGLMESTEQKNHASFVQPAIAELLSKTGLSLNNMDAIAVTIGPGSYTGLRVGLASAKGICYALDKPLITVNTLQAMAQASLRDEKLKDVIANSATILCPLIDARRMEVFTGLYNTGIEEMEAAHALIIDEHSFKDLYENGQVIFSGSGTHKLKLSLSGKNIFYADVQHNAADMAPSALNACQNGHFTDLAYSTPLYVKEFFDPTRPNG